MTSPDQNYTSWHVGMRVVCIKNSVNRINDLGLPPFKKGQLLTVSHLEMMEPYGLFLGFAERDPLNLGHVDGFRPLVTRKTDISALKRILLNPHVRIKEDA